MKKFLYWLVSPSKQLVKADDIRRARYLSSMLIPLIILTPIGSIVSTVEAEQKAVGFLFFAVMIAFIVSRTRYYVAAGVFAVISINIPPYVTLLATEEFTQFTVITWVSWINLPLLLASIWLPLRPVIFIWLINIVVLLLFPIFIREDLSYQSLSVGLMQLIIFGSIIILSSRLRNNDQADLMVQTEKMELARDEAEYSNQVKSMFLAKMSHEFGTPLHGILSFSQFGIDKLEKISVETIRDYFNRIKTSAERLKNLVDGLLDLNSLENDEMSFNFKNTIIVPMIERSIMEQESKLQAKQIEVTVELEENLPQVECDEGRINQVLMNVLDNAIKFSPDAGKIIVSSKHTKLLNNNDLIDAVEIKISDHGNGIKENEKNVIFNKFYQGKDDEFSTGSTGLGLSISCEFVMKHHGKIWCENNPEQGAAFYISLPVKQNYKL